MSTPVSNSNMMNTYAILPRTHKNSKLVLLWILFTATVPFNFHLAIPNHPYKILVFVGLLWIVFKLLQCKSLKFGNNFIVGILLIQASYSLIAAYLQVFILGFDFMYINLTIQLVAVLIVYIYIQSLYSIHKVAISSIFVIAFIGVLGVTAFFLGLAGILKPIGMFPSDNPYYTNFFLTFSNAYYAFGNSTIIRIAGFFDEPGAFAYYITMTLLLNKIYNYSKKIEILLVFVGVFTFSLAFFVSLSLYFLFFYFSVRNIGSLFLVAALVLSAIGFVVHMKDDNEYAGIIYELTVRRLHIAQGDDVKIVRGDNRSQKFIWSKEAFLQSPLIGHGMSAYSNPNSEFYGKLCCNILHPLATDGLIGTFIFYLLFIYWILYIVSRRNIDIVSLGAFMIVFANFFQRPGFYGGLYGYFIFIFLVEATIWRHHNRAVLMKGDKNSLLSRNAETKMVIQ